MKKIRSLAFAFLVLLLIIWGLYAFLFGWVVPKTAAITRPRQWNNLPLHQPKITVRGYLGEPSVPTKDSLVDQWADGSKGKMYFLRIYYATDSVAVAYSIHYEYRNKLVSRNYLIDSFSIR